MNPERLLQNFGRLIDTPDAVPRLRRFILDLAVRGKLVKQNQEDEPAGELLKRIEGEKRLLIKNGTIRAPKSYEQFNETDPLFNLPKYWKWVRLCDVGSIIGGGTPPSKDESCFTEGGKGIAWLTPADLGKHNDLFISHGARDLTETGLATSSAQLMPVGSVLFTIRAPIGYTAIAANKISTNQGFKSVVPYVSESNRYIAVYFKAFASWINSKASGTTFREVSGKIVANLPFPLPPLSEQHRIVAKVDELMKLCDELEATQAKLERRRNRLVTATLYGLNNGDSDSETSERLPFGESARFYFNHLPRLTTRPEHIQQLRQTFLNLAVRGKLVPQDPKDEPAAELCKRIEKEKQHLINAGKIKEQDPQPPIEDGELDYQLPLNWMPTRIGNLLTVIRGASPRPKGDPKYFSSKRTAYHWIKISDIRKHSKDRVLFDTEEFLTEAGMEKSVQLPRGTLIVTNSATIGVPILLGFDGGCIHDGYLAFPYFPESELLKGFFFILFQTLQTYAIKKARGMAQLNLNTGLVRAFPLGLPPLAEQLRIVAKVDELMVLCDEMEKRITTNTTTSRKLLEATLQEAVSGFHQVA
ncbi:MAG: restriction endonuclease subunit S [Nitrospirae bacterium]|nr:restriction endonuclease subunit S [Nitrospirota bacterium]